MKARRHHEIGSLVVPDPQDGRDRTYRPADPAGALPDSVSCEAYRHYVGATWHQRGQECTGFALAAVANYTLRRQADDPALPGVSRRMLYEMAQFYDGEDFAEGSTLRGALRGWRRVGVARDDLWPYVPGDEEGAVQGRLTLARLLDARTRRLLRYERIAAGDIRTMQHALVEGRALYACARYHVGWFRLYIPGLEPEIVQRPDDAMRGGHAFVIAGYDERGFWIHNSFGLGWGDGGYARLPYEDWQANGQDVWVIEAEAVSAGCPPGPAVAPAAVAGEAQATAPPAYRDMWPHLVVLRDDGGLGRTPPWEMDTATVGTLLYVFQERTRNWAQRRLAVIADAGYRPMADTIERLNALREAFLAQEIYPIFLVWETSWWAELEHEIGVWLSRVDGRPGASPADPQAGLALDRSVARVLWSELLERGVAACQHDAGGAKVLAGAIAHKRRQVPFDIHLVSHGAGDLLLEGFLDCVPAPVASVTALAPVGTIARFIDGGARLLQGRLLGRMRVFAHDAAAEQADTTGPLAGSLLSTVAHRLASVEIEVADAATELVPDPAPRPEPILGLARDLLTDERLAPLRQDGRLEVRLVSGPTHLDLPFDPDVQRLLVEGMLAPPLDQGPGLRDPLARALADMNGARGQGA